MKFALSVLLNLAGGFALAQPARPVLVAVPSMENELYDRQVESELSRALGSSVRIYFTFVNPTYKGGSSRWLEIWTTDRSVDRVLKWTKSNMKFPAQVIAELTQAPGEYGTPFAFERQTLARGGAVPAAELRRVAETLHHLSRVRLRIRNADLELVFYDRFERDLNNLWNKGVLCPALLALKRYGPPR